jgi:hypothetical protein
MTTQQQQGQPAPRPVQAQATPKVALLRIGLVPSGGPVSVVINGQTVNPASPITIPVGLALNIQIQKDGFKPVTRQVTAANSADVQVDVVLEPQQAGFLTLDSTPSAKADIKMGDMVWTAQTPINEMKFPPGVYQAHLVNELLGLAKDVSFTIEKDKIIHQDVDLSVMK